MEDDIGSYDENVDDDGESAKCQLMEHQIKVRLISCWKNSE